jgi:hypothetical protein
MQGDSLRAADTPAAAAPLLGNAAKLVVVICSNTPGGLWADTHLVDQLHIVICACG